MTDAACEYAEALEAYNAALVRLREARRHFDPKQAPEAIEQRKAKQAEYRAAKKAARNTPEAKAERARQRREWDAWRQGLENIGQAAIEQRENMPNALRIITRAGDRRG